MPFHNQTVKRNGNNGISYKVHGSVFVAIIRVAIVCFTYGLMDDSRGVRSGTT